ncbi:MAG: hypothetical protein ABJB97_08725 [Acidobacteriota bacterium]
MKTLRLSAILLAGLALSAGATDLVPHYIANTTEGVVIRRPYFADGTKKYGIKIDSETKLTAFEGGALFRFEKFPEATMRLRPSPVPAQTAFGPESLEGYEQAARALLPLGAGAVELVESEFNPLPINDWHSLRLTFSYRAANQPRRQSIIFLNLKPTEQIVIQTAANERDFAEVYARAFNIVRRWHEIVPEDEQPFN